MKKLIILGFLLAISLGSHAQYALSKGQSQFNAGLGFSSWGVPIYAGIDWGVHRDISVGGELSFRSFNDNYPDNKHYRHSIIGIAGNGNYHFNTLLDIPREWDFYAGLNLGFYIWNSDDDYPGNHTSGLGLGAQVGGRYYFNDRFGVNLEVGGANAFSGGKIGITLKL
jgi:outer membrane immunogenic protein